ncbi:MAG: prepilin-type N-terminal cleavage/methylation domain-containing protein, partial [Chloroflexi bacterium]|nr:prepilin-type N-terminal cleavage/methylation domain-containing protein [Chloroflexota bacterium]
MLHRLQQRREDEGFTLIELLVVIIILAVLAAIVVFAVGGINNNSKTSACKADKKTVETAEEAYYATNNAYVDSDSASMVPKFLAEASVMYKATAAAGGGSYT